MVLGKVNDFMTMISSASSSHLDYLLTTASHEVRSRVLAEMRLLTSGVCEELASKLSHHRELPWKLLGGFGSHLNRDVEAKSCLQECCAMFDSLWAEQAKRKSLHRMSVYFLGPDSELRPLVDMYTSQAMPLEQFSSIVLCPA
jgi:hypothetical protein